MKRGGSKLSHRSSLNTEIIVVILCTFISFYYVLWSDNLLGQLKKKVFKKKDNSKDKDLTDLESSSESTMYA